MKKQTLELMKNTELEAFLDKRGIAKNTVVCSMCEEDLKLKEVKVIAIKDGRVLFSCDKPFCFRRLNSQHVS